MPLSFFRVRGKDRRQLFRALDCSCSALALNCLQLPCMSIPHRPFVDHPCASDTANWMKRLHESCCQNNKSDDDDEQEGNGGGSILLRDLIIPGTHDSASSTISGALPFSGVGWTQNLSVTEQLKRGARYLDVRVASASGKEEDDCNDSSPSGGLAIWHGCLKGTEFGSVVREIATFLKEHSGEFLVLEVVPEYGRPFSSDQRKACLQELYDELGGAETIWAPGNNKSLSQCTLEQVVVREKRQVLVLLHNRFYKNLEGMSQSDVQGKYGFVSSQQWMNNRWHNTREVDKLLHGNDQEVQRNGGNKARWLNNQFVMTPGAGGAMDILNALVGQNSLRPVTFAVQLYDTGVMDEYLRRRAAPAAAASADEGGGGAAAGAAAAAAAAPAWNILSVDYMDLCPNIIHFLISLNFPVELEILLASVAATDSSSSSGSAAVVDVTEKVRSLVCRKRALFLINVADDLGLEYDEGKLTIACRLGGVHKVLEVAFDSSTQVLIGHFTCNCDDHESCGCDHNDDERLEIGQVRVDDAAAAPRNGYVHEGQIYTSGEQVADKSGTVMKFCHHSEEEGGGGCKCDFTLHRAS